jgi:transcriptional regulator with XRE-family HTH domain
MGYQSIGMKIQEARLELGLTQQELASELGLTQAALSNYEKGKRRMYLANLEHIATVLGKPLSYFIDSLDSNEEDDSRSWYARYPYR